MNRAVNASPAEQGRISRIDYGVNALLRYVAYNDGDSPAQERFYDLRAIHRLNLISPRGRLTTLLTKRATSIECHLPIALLNTQHCRSIPLWHLPDRDTGHLFQRLEVDHRNGVRTGVGHVSRLAVGRKRHPVWRQSHVS